MHLKTMAVGFASLQPVNASILSHLFPSLANEICCSGSHLEIPWSSQRGGRLLLGFLFYFWLIRTGCFSHLLDDQKLLLHQGSAVRFGRVLH